MVGLGVDIFKKVRLRRNKKNFSKKDFSLGYKEMQVKLNTARNYKNLCHISSEEDSLEELKQLINQRINAIKDN